MAIRDGVVSHGNSPAPEAPRCCGHAADSHGQAHHHGHEGPPTEILRAEHALILQALDALEQRLLRLEAGQAPDPAYFRKAVLFLQTFADQCHHGKEENLLFKTMVERGFPQRGGPIAVMLSEHETGRSHIRGMAEAIARLEQDPEAARRLVEHGHGYIALLRAHIQKENNILFPLADSVLSPEDQSQLGEAFERFEREETGAGTHEASLKLLEELRTAAP